MATKVFLAITALLATQQSAMNIESYCIIFKINVGKFPSELKDLVEKPDGMTRVEWGGPFMDKAELLDPWGNQFGYSADDEEDQVAITSAGPDGEHGTEDDIEFVPRL